MNCELPQMQRAVQLTGADELTFNDAKAVHVPGSYQILCKVEAVGLCFSDLKLLKQFADHARKGDIISGMGRDVLDEIPSYVPADEPTVPGHESVVRVVAIGDKVEGVELGGRYLVQTDYRWLPTEHSNASFGYNFEGGLQQYVLMDQRVITSPDGECLLIPASDNLSASAIALVEPWACVEDAYVAKERTTLTDGGRMLVVTEGEVCGKQFIAFLGRFGTPGEITLCGSIDGLSQLSVPVESVSDVAGLDDVAFDDVVYFGSDADVVESLFDKVAARGLFNIVKCGGSFGRNVNTEVGRVHYGGIRIIGTDGDDPSDSMQYIPGCGEIRKGDKIDVIGAGGPMGVMHVIRNLCQGIEGVTVYAGDLDEERLSGLSKIAQPLADKNNVTYTPYDPSKNEVDVEFDYVALMAPIPGLVAQAVDNSGKGSIINIFAGIPAGVRASIDLDRYVDKHIYFVGTSGSVLDDMKAVLAKVEAGRLDTDLSVAAICGLESAVEGIRAVENRLIPGKIIVYPDVVGLPLTTLDKLGDVLPNVDKCLVDGIWTKAAEDALLGKDQ